MELLIRLANSRLTFQKSQIETVDCRNKKENDITLLTYHLEL